MKSYGEGISYQTDGPLPEYEINESGIMVLCKACDRYLELLRDDGQHHVQSEQDNEQDVKNAIIAYCKEPKTSKEIIEYFGLQIDCILKDII